MQISVQIACECGIVMEAYLGNKWVCPSCNKAFQSQIPVNKNNGQLRPDQVESVLWFLETLHQEKPVEVGGPDCEPVESEEEFDAWAANAPPPAIILPSKSGDPEVWELEFLEIDWD